MGVFCGSIEEESVIFEVWGCSDPYQGHWPYDLDLRTFFIAASVFCFILAIMAQGPIGQTPSSYINTPSYVEATSSFSDKEVLYADDANSEKTQSISFSTSFIDFKPVAIPRECSHRIPRNHSH